MKNLSAAQQYEIHGEVGKKGQQLPTVDVEIDTCCGRGTQLQRSARVRKYESEQTEARSMRKNDTVVSGR